MRPLIGIPCHTGNSFSHNREKPIMYSNTSYIQAIDYVGGIPVLIPALQDLHGLQALFPRLDGLLLPGGPDVDPRHYQQQPHELLGKTSASLDALELTLAHWAIQKGVPTLGICRGMQLLNVALGGDLYQDLGERCPDTWQQHCNWDQPRNDFIHRVAVKAGSRMEKILGQSVIAANSLHHQAVHKPGKGVVISGYSEDGVAELMEVSDHPFMLATQCHPEEVYLDEPAWTRLFAALTDASTKRMMQQVELSGAFVAVTDYAA
jgi:putative glutamine amidotransferase